MTEKKKIDKNLGMKETSETQTASRKSLKARAENAKRVSEVMERKNKNDESRFF